jgi:hypothetical protein
MEFVLVIAVIVVLCILLGVSVKLLLIGAAALFGLIFAAAVLLLGVFFVRLLFAKKKKAVFSRIDKSPRGRFKVAYYVIDGTEYPNVFPEEGLFRSVLYKSSRSSTVFLARNKRFVYDKYACATCIIGFAAGIAAAVYVTALFLNT